MPSRLFSLARELGWFVAVADGRSHLATRERFPTADDVRVLPDFELPGAAPRTSLCDSTDAAVVMTHSFEQDSRVLASLLALEFPLAYLGVLGPQRRTRELLAEAARLLHLPDTEDRVDRWLAQMHAPTGLDLGRKRLPTIALSILAEIQQALTAATGTAAAPGARRQGIACELLRNLNAARDGSPRQPCAPGALPALPETSPAMPDAPSMPGLSPGFRRPLLR